MTAQLLTLGTLHVSINILGLSDSIICKSATIDGDSILISIPESRSYLAGHGFSIVIQQVSFFLAILGFDVRGLPRFSAVQRDLYIGGLAKTEETLWQKTKALI